MKAIIITLILAFIWLFCFTQEIPYPQQPDWESVPNGNYSTGLGIADINGDGWKDLIISNGNDMARQNVVVYYNNGDGTFPDTPSWESDDIDYHGHVATGDFNNDGYIDIAVSVYIGPSGFSSPGKLKVYYNQAGELESTPSFESEGFYTFSCATGDADGDGDLDIAIAGGEVYYNKLEHGRIYYNDSGNFSDDNVWMSDIEMGAMDVEFCDFDLNGYLDVVYTCNRTSNYIYLANDQGDISTTASWESANGNNFTNSVDAGYKFNETDSTTFIVVTGNNQLGGDGKIKMYEFDGFPAPANASWISDSVGHGSGVLLYDVTINDTLDMIYGGWWQAIRIALGTTDGFELDPSYTSSTHSVVEAIHVSDLGKESYLNEQIVIYIQKESSVIILPEQNVEKIDEIRYNGAILETNQYKHIPGKTHVSFTNELSPGDELIIDYTYSPHVDIIISNWDSGKGNYIFYNTNDPIGMDELATDIEGDIIKSVYPNPFRDITTISHVSNTSIRKCLIYDEYGRVIKQINPLYLNGEIKLNLSNLSDGIYYIYMQNQNETDIERIVKIK